ncbi:YopX family protein [Brevibacillus ruminantium]|uniref:YopX family protein n=1 Tax=Brevibacillus ruminantium TaxID=2950604 RepID=A0ABY4WAY2_9BACL|nr:YopX family protein [Brevibacillus ruminantium]USG64006.1 YopX family protein [Brevibacillus ruminantium]
MQARGEIKFRAWDGKKLISTVYPKSNHKFEVDWDGKFKLHTFSERQEITDEHGESWKQPVWEVVENAVIMQFTGLRDKHGKEIYESDILLESLSFDEKYAHVVVWSQDDCAWMFEYDGDLFTASEMNFEQCEIVGNVYEKPELLEAGK